MSIPQSSCQESWWGLLGQKGHRFPPEAVAWAPELLLLSLQHTPHLSLSPSVRLIHSLNALSLLNSLYHWTHWYMETLLMSWWWYQTRLQYRRCFKGVSLRGCRRLLSQWLGVESSDVMLAVCLCVHPHCVTQVYRWDNKQRVFSPIGSLQACIRLFKRLSLHHWDRITDHF